MTSDNRGGIKVTPGGYGGGGGDDYLWATLMAATCTGSVRMLQWPQVMVKRVTNYMSM